MVPVSLNLIPDGVVAGVGSFRNCLCIRAILRKTVDHGTACGGASSDQRLRRAVVDQVLHSGRSSDDFR